MTTGVIYMIGTDNKLYKIRLTHILTYCITQITYRDYTFSNARVNSNNCTIYLQTTCNTIIKFGTLNGIFTIIATDVTFTIGKNKTKRCSKIE